MFFSRLWSRFFLPSGAVAAFEPILTQRLLLRLPTGQDADSYAALAGDPEIAKWMLNFPAPFPVALAEQRIAQAEPNHRRGASTSLIAIDRQDGSLVGGVALNNMKALPQPELAYWVRTDRWRQGLAAEMCAAILDYAFEVRRDAQVSASVLPENQSSVALLRQLGFEAAGKESLWAEPYAPTAGMSLAQMSQHLLLSSAPQVSVELDRWMLTKQRWAQRGA